MGSFGINAFDFERKRVTAAASLNPPVWHRTRASGNSVALGAVAPQLVGCAGGEVTGVDLDLGVDDAEGLLEVVNLLAHLRLVPAKDLESLGLVARALHHQLRVAADFGERHPRRAQLGHSVVS